MAIYEGDQPTGQTTVINGVHASLNAAAVKAAVVGSALAYRFTASYTFHNPVLNGQPLSFRRGVSYHLDSALRTSLLAASAPMVAL